MLAGLRPVWRRLGAPPRVSERPSERGEQGLRREEEEEREEGQEEVGWGGVGQRGAQVASQGYPLPLPLRGDERTSASPAARPVINASNWIWVIRKINLVFLVFLYLGQ